MKEKKLVLKKNENDDDGKMFKKVFYKELHLILTPLKKKHLRKRFIAGSGS